MSMGGRTTSPFGSSKSFPRKLCDVRCVVFATLEDETGIVNVIVWPAMLERYRKAVLGARQPCVRGLLQCEGLVIHIVGERLTDLPAAIGELPDLREGVGRAAHSSAAEALPPARSFR